jgi:hypothetical protein
MRGGGRSTPEKVQSGGKLSAVAKARITETGREALASED